jgi:hypothetical protein
VRDKRINEKELNTYFILKENFIIIPIAEIGSKRSCFFFFYHFFSLFFSPQIKKLKKELKEIKIREEVTLINQKPERN